MDNQWQEVIVVPTEAAEPETEIPEGVQVAVAKTARSCAQRQGNSQGTPTV